MPAVGNLLRARAAVLPHDYRIALPCIETYRLDHIAVEHGASGVEGEEFLFGERGVGRSVFSVVLERTDGLPLGVEERIARSRLCGAVVDHGIVHRGGKRSRRPSTGLGECIGFLSLAVDLVDHAAESQLRICVDRTGRFTLVVDVALGIGAVVGRHVVAPLSDLTELLPFVAVAVEMAPAGALRHEHEACRFESDILVGAAVEPRLRILYKYGFHHRRFRIGGV